MWVTPMSGPIRQMGYSLLSNKHGVKKLRCYSVCVQGACGQRAETCREENNIQCCILRHYCTSMAVTWQVTAEYEIDPGEASHSGFALVWSPNLGALHSDQGEDSTKEAQTYSSDHQTPAGLDVAWKNKRGPRQTSVTHTFRPCFLIWCMVSCCYKHSWSVLNS